MRRMLEVGPATAQRLPAVGVTLLCPACAALESPKVRTCPVCAAIFCEHEGRQGVTRTEGKPWRKDWVCGDAFRCAQRHGQRVIE